MTTLSPQRFRIVFLGRPNVGKSTLFNRLVGSRTAVVSSTRGTTRDRLYGSCEWRGTTFTLIDTGGVEFETQGSIAAAVQRHVQQALREADGVILVCDANDGLVPADQLILDRIRRADKPTLVVVNKVDHRLDVASDFFSLGVEEILPVSALHGRGINGLLDRLVTWSRRAANGRAEPFVLERPTLAVAIVGRQNVGKSSLLNALLREERAIVSEVPGTTRDAVDTELRVSGDVIRLIDTAGLRHRRKVRHPVDLFSMARTIEAIKHCDVAVVVLDATQGVTRDDQRIITQVCQAGRGLVLVVNKWDLVKGGSERTLTQTMRRLLPGVTFAPVAAVSAKTGFQVAYTLTLARQVVTAMQRGLSETECIALLRRAWIKHQPPRFRGRVICLQQARWIPGSPIRLELTTRPLGRLPEPYLHFLLKQLYADPRLSGIPIQLTVKAAERR